MAVTVLRPRPEASASWRIDAPARCATRIMSSRMPASFAARSALGSRRRHLGVGLTHLSSRSPVVSLSRIAISGGTEGTSRLQLFSESLRPSFSALPRAS